MEVRITTLSENTANYGFLAEWGHGGVYWNNLRCKIARVINEELR